MVVLSCNYVVLLTFLVVFTLNDNMVTIQGKQASIQLGAPMAQKSLERLQGEIFGSGRAARSTYCIIFNVSKHVYQLVANSCSHGHFTSDLFPEPWIAAQSSTVFGMESHGFMTGVECILKYESTSDAKTYFELRSNNPYAGSVEASEFYSSDLKYLRTKGGGNNNQVRWIIEDVPTAKSKSKTVKSVPSIPI